MWGVLRIFAFMIVELPCRYLKKLDKDAQRELDRQLDTERIIQGEDFDEEAERLRLVEEEEQYEYGLFTFNMKDICAFNEIDAGHTAVRFYNNAICVFKLEYIIFKQLYQEVTGLAIRTLT
jgi:hypothetical protein